MTSQSGVQRFFIGALDLVGKVWTLPNTLVGLLVGVAGMSRGAAYQGFDPACNAFVFTCFPRGRGAITIGNVVITTTRTLDIDVPTYAAAHAGRPYTDWVNLHAHECAHTYQYQVLGPFFALAYFLCGGAFTYKSPFEVAADRYGKTGKGWWPW